ncbi:MAG: prepilin peptidase [Acetobacteraceae bacterium]|nr:prepilin peptidase [Acetobacteraceae bacterium]
MMVWLPLVTAPFVGSFLGVLIRDLPAERPLLRARSRCEACGTVLGVEDLVPVVSYVAARGRCRHCRAAIGAFYIAIELAALFVAACVAATVFDSADVWAGCVLSWTLLALAWIDAEHLYLPDVLTLPLVLAGLAATWWLDPDALFDHAVAAALGYVGLRLIGAVYARLRGREGLGQGDAKLLAGSGAWLGVAALAWVLLVSAVIGIGVALVMAIREPDIGRREIPFGPPLALATWLIWLLSYS